MKKKEVKSVVILGMGPSYVDYHTETVTQDRKEDIADEIWTINAACFDHRPDRIWWMDDLKKERIPRKYTIDRLAFLDVPVMTTTAYPEIVKKSLTYPIDDACRLSMDIFGKVYLNNTISYAVAYAIIIGVEQLALYGCDFTYVNRNFAESGRACLESWVTAYKSIGGHVLLAPSTHLFDNCGRVDSAGRTVGYDLYGYDTQPVIDLGDGKKAYFGKSEPELVQEKILKYMTDGPGKNADEIDRLNLRLKGFDLTNRLDDIDKARAETEKELKHLKLKEVENGIRSSSKAESGSGSGSAGDNDADPVGQDAPAATSIPG